MDFCVAKEVSAVILAATSAVNAGSNGTFAKSKQEELHRDPRMSNVPYRQTFSVSL